MKAPLNFVRTSINVVPQIVLRFLLFCFAKCFPEKKTSLRVAVTSSVSAR
ncbi:hypothetical protein ACVMIH_007457 [Bradyrhizobium sp. USDA 4503]